MMSLELSSHYGPSLHVSYNSSFPGYVFAAIGPFIHIYDCATSRLVNRVRVFIRNKIHGFCFSGNGNGLCLAYGGKSVSLATVDELLKVENIVDRERVYFEWIVHGTFSFDEQNVYLLTSYNKVLVSDLEFNIVKRAELPNERSILYSGAIKVLSDGQVLVCAGTVMGGILLWDLNAERILHNLLGHEGSIFCVTVSDDGKRVATCSDDRSIRLWDLCGGDELSVGWGHTARIWDLKFFANDKKLVSVSEDCTCRVWDIMDGKTLALRNVYDVHLTKNVWSVAVDEEAMTVVTSGNDGRIKLTDLRQQERYGKQQSFAMVGVLKECGVQMNSKELFKGFYYFEFGMIAITSEGNVLRYLEATGKWDLVLHDPMFVSYSVTTAIRSENGENNVIVFVNNRANLIILNMSADGRTIRSQNMAHVEGLSKSCNVILRRLRDDHEHCILALDSPNPNEKLTILKMRIETLDVLETYQFKKPDNFVLSSLEVEDGRYIVAGSRFSTLAIFDMHHPNTEAYTIRELDPGDTITSVNFIEKRGKQCLFSVTNRDGYYHFISINFASLRDSPSTTPSHEIVHLNRISKGFLEGGFYDSHGDFIIYGFKSSHFYIYNETKCYEIANVPCGGAHRQWRLCSLPIGPDLTSKMYMLVFVKASELFVQRICRDSSVPEVLEAGIHGREIRSVTTLPLLSSGNTGPDAKHFLVTGSEDATIKLSSLKIPNGNVEVIWTMRHHVSGLQRTKFINNQLMISCSAREELFLWRLTTSFSSAPYMVIKKVLPVQRTHPDLRIMDFDALFPSSDGSDFLLATAYSDSTVRLWYYDNKLNEFSELWTTHYTPYSCILNVKFVPLQNGLYLLITPTDGKVVLYDITGSLPRQQLGTSLQGLSWEGSAASVTSQSGVSPVCSLLAHKSGIRAVDTYVSGDRSKCYVITGGDDNALCISVILANNGDKKVVSAVKHRIDSAASSTITSCKIFDDNRKVLTTSVDQIVRVWDILDGDDALSLKASQYTTVADVGASDVVKMVDSPREYTLLVGGVGLSIFRFDVGSLNTKTLT